MKKKDAQCSTSYSQFFSISLLVGTCEPDSEALTSNTRDQFFFQFKTIRGLEAKPPLTVVGAKPREDSEGQAKIIKEEIFSLLS